MNGNNSDCWIRVCGVPAPDVATMVSEHTRQKLSGGSFSERTRRDIEKLSLCVADGSLSLSDLQLEKMRRLCQLWDIDIRIGNISSHRKITGPFIVAFKKLLFPLIRVLLKDLIEQQREFNATSIALLADCASRSPQKDPRSPL